MCTGRPRASDSPLPDSTSFPHDSLIPSPSRLDVSQRLPNLDALAHFDGELERLGRLEDEDDRAPEPEATDLVTGLERLAAEEGRSLGVGRFAVGSRGDGTEGRVGAEGLVRWREGA